MESQAAKPKFSIMKGRDFPLSGPALVQLLRSVLSKGAFVRFRAKGFSMTPFIKNEDIITLSPLKTVSPNIGDVIAIVLRDADKLCVHRVVGKRGDRFLTKGDNSSDTDGAVPKDSILGFVTRVERNGKEVSRGLGPERFLIAFLGGRGLLLPLILPMWKLLRIIVKRSPS